VADSRGRGGGCPLLTGCILKQVKILHQNALFLPKIFKNFLRRGLPTPTLPPPIPNFWIRRWCFLVMADQLTENNQTPWLLACCTAAFTQFLFN